nr:hypothetical protein [Micromonospora sp. DSM 115978]
MEETYRWPVERTADLRDGLTQQEVVEALYAPVGLRMDNRVPAEASTFIAICAPTEQQRLIVILCTRADSGGPWTILAAREAAMGERAMWRRYTT